MYLKKAGTIILGVSIVLWAMTTYPKKREFRRDYAAGAARARAAYLADVKALNADLGLAPDSEVLTQAIQAELDLAAEQAKYHKHESGFAAAAKNKDAVLRELKQGDGGASLARFLEIRQVVKRNRAAFAEAVKEYEVKESSTAYLIYEQRLGTALATVEKTAPRVYTAALKYLDSIEAPYREKMTRVGQAKQAEELAYSVAGRIGHGLEPVFRPIGFDWRINTALIGAFAAKEVFIAQLGIVYSVGETGEGSEALRAKLRDNYTPLTAFCIMLFCLVSAPCIATIAVTRQESGSWKWALLQLGGLTVLAYILSFIVYQFGILLGIGI